MAQIALKVYHNNRTCANYFAAFSTLPRELSIAWPWDIAVASQRMQGWNRV